MADGLKHLTLGADVTQVEFEADDTHLLPNQVTGDLGYASSASVFRRLAKGSDRFQLGMTSTIPAWFTPAFDGIVDAAGGGHWTTLQAGDDELDAGNYTMLVKQGTYTAGLTVSTGKAYIFVEPGTVIQGNVLLSGADVTLVLGAGCDIQGVVTFAGTGGKFDCLNGVDLDGLVMSGNFGYATGGGWETIVDGGVANHAIIVSGADVVVKDITAKTTGGGGQSFSAVYVTGSRADIDGVHVPDCDTNAIATLTGIGSVIRNCRILGGDSRGMAINQLQSGILNNFIKDVVSVGIELQTGSDDTVCNGNTVQDNASGAPIELHPSAENCTVVGNRTDGAITDSSGTSTVVGNDETAF